MRRNPRIGLLVWLLPCLALGCWSVASGDAPPPTAPAAEAEGLTVRAAIERSLPYLEADGDAWMEGKIPVQDGKGCVSCHQVPFAVWSLREAKRAGIPVPEAELADLDRRARAFIADPDVGRVMSWTPMLLGRPDSETDPQASDLWHGYRDEIVNAQRGDGYWDARGQFPDQKRERLETDAVATLWTLLALEGLRPPTASAEASAREAKEWIDGREAGASNEWWLARALLETASGGGEAAREMLLEILDEQREDGGWSFAPGDPSNAYSTGQTLYTLRRVGLEAHHPAVQRAAAYLLSSQREDGTWAVPSKLTSAEPSAGKDYIYEYWGTAWAVIGLAQIEAASARLRPEAPPAQVAAN